MQDYSAFDNLDKASVVDEPVKWHGSSRPSRLTEQITALLHKSYDDDKSMCFPITLKGYNAVKRDGSDSGVDHNVKQALNLLRRTAREWRYGLRTEVQVSPDEGVAYLTFKAGELTRQPKNQTTFD